MMWWPNEMDTDQSGIPKGVGEHEQRKMYVALRHIHRYHSKISYHVIILVSSVFKQWLRIFTMSTLEIAYKLARIRLRAIHLAIVKWI